MFPGIHHDDYQDHSTREERTWMLHIHHLVKADEARRSEEANKGT